MFLRDDYMNTRFEYLYRDAGNFKNWGDIIFANPSDIPISVITQRAHKTLIDQSYFVARKADIPDLHFPDYNNDLDHEWHEFHLFAETNDSPTDMKNRSVDEFLQDLHLASKI